MPDNDFDPHGYFDLPDSSKLDHCPKCGRELVDEEVRITRPDGQVRKVMACHRAGLVFDGVLYAEYEGSLPV